MEDEEINVPIWGWFIIFFIIGLLIGGSLMSVYKKNTKYRTPEEIASYLEEMLLQNKHYEDLQHSQLRGLLKLDTTTIGQFKFWYLRYNESGISRRLLIDQVNQICFKREFKYD